MNLSVVVLCLAFGLAAAQMYNDPYDPYYGHETTTHKAYGDGDYYGGGKILLIALSLTSFMF